MTLSVWRAALTNWWEPSYANICLHSIEASLAALMLAICTYGSVCSAHEPLSKLVACENRLTRPLGGDVGTRSFAPLRCHESIAFVSNDCS